MIEICHTDLARSNVQRLPSLGPRASVTMTKSTRHGCHAPRTNARRTIDSTGDLGLRTMPGG
jgi:hypothetical protein